MTRNAILLLSALATLCSCDRIQQMISGGDEEAEGDPIALEFEIDSSQNPSVVKVKTEPGVRVSLSHDGSRLDTIGPDKTVTADADGVAEFTVKSWSSVELKASAYLDGRKGRAEAELEVRKTPQLSIKSHGKMGPKGTNLFLGCEGEATAEGHRPAKLCSGHGHKVRMSTAGGLPPLQFDISSNPAVKSVSIPGATVTKEGESFVASVDLRKVGGTITVEDRTLSLPLQFELPDGASGKGTLTFDASIGHGIMEQAASGGVVFADEPAPSGPPDAAVLLWKGFGVRGKAKTLADVDLVVVADRKTVTKQKCRYTGQKIVERVAHNLTLTVHDRRKGTKVASKTFYGKAPERCPSTVLSTGSNVLHGDYDSKAAEDWLEATLATKLKS